jgi:hypothetical protein
MLYTATMTKFIVFLVCIACLNAEAQRKLPKVLFIGNSHTYVNNVPEMVQQMAAAQGILLEVQAVTYGGYKLEDHLKLGWVQKALQQNGYNTIILQEQSSRPVEEFALFKQSVQTIAAIAQKYKTEVVLYINWWRADMAVEQSQWDNNFRVVANTTKSKLAPVGTAWANAVKSGVNIQTLRHSDGIHAAPAGSYLAALTIYSSLTGLNPVGLPRQFKVTPSVVDQELSSPVNLEPIFAKNLQQAAWKTFQNLENTLRPIPLR